MNSFIAVSCFLAVLGLTHGGGVGVGLAGHGMYSAPIIRTAAVAPVIARPIVPIVRPIVPIVRPIVTPIVRPILRTVPIGLGWGRGLGLYGGYGLYGQRSGLGGYGLYGSRFGLGGYGLYGRGLGLGGLYGGKYHG